MKKITRENSLVTQKNTLESLITYKNFPVYIGCTNEARDKDICEDMTFDICVESGMIQLRQLLPLSIVYQFYHSEAVKGIWKEHHENFARFIARSKPKNIVEIGGSNGYLAEYYLDNIDDIEWLIIEPTPKVNIRPNLKLFKGFLEDYPKKFNLNDSFVHSHTLEHCYDINNFLKRISDDASNGSHHIFSIPNLLGYIKKKFTNNLNFEHTFLLDEDLVEYFLNKYNFEIVEIEYFRDHSIFYRTKKNDDLSSNKIIKNNYLRNKTLFIDFVDEIKNEVDRINAEIRDLENIFLFGAHIFSQFLINFGLDTKNIKKIIDNSDLKRGKRLYGTNLFVEKPNYLAKESSATLILKAGQYQSEIEKQIISINSKIKIIN